MNSFMVAEGESFRFNYIPAVSYSLELGNVSDFADGLDELIDIIDDLDSSDESPTELRDRFNSVLARIGDQGYIKSGLSVRAPILPLFYKSDSLGGTLSLDFSVDANVAASVLDDELVIDKDKGAITSTSVYLKSSLEKSLSLSYSRELWVDKDKGKLYGGLRLKTSNMELSKQIMPLQLLDGKDIEDVMRDEYDQNLVSTTAPSLDLGFVWEANSYRIGLTFSDLNSPEFNYGPVGVNCEAREDGSPERSSCEVSRYFIEVKGDLQAYETHTKHARTTVDGALKVGENLWLTSALDLAAYDDTVGYENQWFHTAAYYETHSIFLPSSVGAGYQVNLTGSETSSMNLGATFFNVVNFDIEYGLESVDVDGSTVPRRLGFSLSFTEHY